MPAKRKKKKQKKHLKPLKHKISASPLHPALQDPEELLVRFLQRVLQWLNDNHARVVNLFRKLDSDGDNVLSTEDFFIGMRMMEAPATKKEIDRLVTIIDMDNNGRIDILEFDKVVRGYHRVLLSQRHADRSSEPDEDMIVPTANLTFSPSRLSIKCPNCDIGLAGPPKEKGLRFIQLKLTLAPFKDLQYHPGHFEVEVSDSTTIHGLSHLILDHLEGSVSTIALFRKPDCSKQSYLAPTLCLFHAGAIGGLRTDPPQVEVFYDYKALMNDCPILMDESHLANVSGGKKKKTCGITRSN